MRVTLCKFWAVGTQRQGAGDMVAAHYSRREADGGVKGCRTRDMFCIGDCLREVAL